MHIFTAVAATAIAAACICASNSAQARTVTVTLDGDWYLQAGTVLSDIGIATMSYQLGRPVTGRAVFQPWMATGYAEAPIGDAAGRYSRHTWELFGVTSYTFSGLDLDRVNLPDESIDLNGNSMRGAYIEVTWTDGFYRQLHINETPWNVDQVLTWTDTPNTPPVPEPSTTAMLAAGAAAIAAMRRRVRTI